MKKILKIIPIFLKRCRKGVEQMTKRCRSCENYESLLWAVGIVFLILFVILVFSLKHINYLKSSSIPIPEGYEIMNVTECHNVSYYKCYIAIPESRINDKSWKEVIIRGNLSGDILINYCFEDNKTICTTTNQQYTETCLEYKTKCDCDWLYNNTVCGKMVYPYFDTPTHTYCNVNSVCTKLQRTYVFEKGEK